MLDLTAVRMFYLNHVPNDPFSAVLKQALTCTVLDYAYQPTGNAEDGLHLCEGETAYLLEAFGYDLDVINMTQRSFMSGLLPHYSLASKHPILVGNIFKMLMEPKEQERLIAKFPQLTPSPCP